MKCCGSTFLTLKRNKSRTPATDFYENTKVDFWTIYWSSWVQTLTCGYDTYILKWTWSLTEYFSVNFNGDGCPVYMPWRWRRSLGCRCVIRDADSRFGDLDTCSRSQDTNNESLPCQSPILNACRLSVFLFFCFDLCVFSPLLIVGCAVCWRSSSQ